MTASAIGSIPCSRTLAAGIPGAQLVVLDDASHLSVIEQPLAFAEVIQRFIAQL